MTILKYLLLSLLLVLTVVGQTQTLAEWTQQRKTQINYLLQQVAALKGYVGQLQQGYAIVQKGLTTIGSITNGEFQLHQGIFDALKFVDPALYNYARLPEFARQQWQLARQVRQLIQHMKENKQFTWEEVRYVERVLGRITTASMEVLDELIELVTSNTLSMSDAARLVRIDQARHELSNLQRVFQGFNQSNWVLAAQRLREANEVETTTRLYNLK